MTHEEAEAYAARWAEAWNSRDADAVLEDFAENVVFVSPTALAVVGTSTVRGKDALRAYWSKALGQISAIQFAVDRVLWDTSRRELAIIYTAAINGKSKRVSENLTFNADGKVMAAEVFHGIGI